MKRKSVTIAEGVAYLRGTGVAALAAPALAAVLRVLPGNSEFVLDVDGKRWLATNRGSEIALRSGVSRVVLPRVLVEGL